MAAVTIAAVAMPVVAMLTTVDGFFVQCPNPKTWSFAGELLLGLKFNPTGAAESLRDKPQITAECGMLGGQLQVRFPHQRTPLLTVCTH